MKKLTLVCLLVLFITAHAVAEISMDEQMLMLHQDLEDLNEKENEIQKLFDQFSSWKQISEHKGTNLVSVDSFGAVGDGVSDDTKAFLSAWQKACSTPRSVLLVPGRQRRYLVKPAKFQGPCVDKLTVQINGTIVAPDDPDDWDPKKTAAWLEFSKLKSVSFQGDGVIDGSGSKWWAASCKTNKANPCRSAPTALTIDSSSIVQVKGLTIQNSQQMHFVISRSETVRVFELKVSAPEDSPNTDGIHITGSTNVILQNCKVGTGDDCISIVNGSSTIKMKNIHCGPGHGISIGSLGKDQGRNTVSQVVLDTAVLKDTTNGLRIKTWQGGSGFVRSVRFENVRMEEVANPIIIDQFYCDSPDRCKNQTSAVKISQVVYRNVSGTTNSAKAINFACSDSVPCSNIVLSNINLENTGGTAEPEAYCHSATGFHYGVVHPSANCLQSSDKGSHSDQIKDDDDGLIKPYYSGDGHVHTEL